MPAAILIPAIASVAAGGAAAGAAVYGSKKSSSAAKSAAQYQTSSANYAADLESKAADRALEFTKQTEAQRLKEWQITQDRNKAIYDQETAREQGRYNDLQARMQPYRNFGAGALGQLSQPIYGAGSLGARIGG